MEHPFGQEAHFTAKEHREELMPMELMGILYHIM